MVGHEFGDGDVDGNVSVGFGVVGGDWQSVTSGWFWLFEVHCEGLMKAISVASRGKWLSKNDY